MTWDDLTAEEQELILDWRKLTDVQQDEALQQMKERYMTHEEIRALVRSKIPHQRAAIPLKRKAQPPFDVQSGGRKCY